jgi:hypothetical protein
MQTLSNDQLEQLGAQSVGGNVIFNRKFAEGTHTPEGFIPVDGSDLDEAAKALKAPKAKVAKTEAKAD